MCIMGVAAQGLNLCTFSVETVISGMSAVLREEPSWTQFSSDGLFRPNCIRVFPLLWLVFSPLQSDGTAAAELTKLSAGKGKFLGEKQEETETLLLNVTGGLLLMLLHL